MITEKITKQEINRIQKIEHNIKYKKSSKEEINNLAYIYGKLISKYSLCDDLIKNLFISKLEELFSNLYVFKLYEKNLNSEIFQSGIQNLNNETSNYSGLKIEKKFFDYEIFLKRNKKKIQILAVSNKDGFKASEVFNSNVFVENDNVIFEDLEKQNCVLEERIKERRNNFGMKNE